MSGKPLPAAADALEGNTVSFPEPLRRRRQALFLRNVGAIIVAGVGISWWLIEFTDFFPAVGGLLGLGGVFAWIAFLSNLIGDDRKKELQADLEKRVLLAPATATFALLALTGFALLAATQGTIVIVGAPDARRTVEVREDGRLLDTFHVPPGSMVKRTFFVNQSALTVKPVGYPERRVQLKSFDRERFSIPNSFTGQEVLLGYLPLTLTTSATNAQVKVFIRRKASGKWEWYGFVPPSTYDGQSFWIGTTADVDLPEHVKARWKDESQDALDRLLNPRAVTAEQPLAAGDSIRVCVMNADAPEKSTLASGEVEIISIRQQRFPQVLELQEHAEAPRGRCP